MPLLCPTGVRQNILISTALPPSLTHTSSFCLSFAQNVPESGGKTGFEWHAPVEKSRPVPSRLSVTFLPSPGLASARHRGTRVCRAAPQSGQSNWGPSKLCHPHTGMARDTLQFPRPITLGCFLVAASLALGTAMQDCVSVPSLSLTCTVCKCGALRPPFSSHCALWMDSGAEPE